MEDHEKIPNKFSTASFQSRSELVELYLSLGPERRSNLFPDTAHAAQILGVSQRTIQFWIEVGNLTAIQTQYK